MGRSGWWVAWAVVAACGGGGGASAASATAAPDPSSGTPPEIDRWATPRIVYFAHVAVKAKDRAVEPGGLSAYQGP